MPREVQQLQQKSLYSIYDATDHHLFSELALFTWLMTQCHHRFLEGIHVLSSRLTLQRELHQTTSLLTLYSNFAE